MATKEHDAARKDAVRMRVRAFDDADDEDAEASAPKMAPCLLYTSPSPRD